MVYLSTNSPAKSTIMSHEYTVHIHTWIMSGWVINHMLSFFFSLTPSKFNIAPEKWLLEDNHSLLNFRWVNQNPIYHLPTTTGPEFSSLFNLGVTLSHFVASIHALQILSLQPGVFGSDSCGWPAIPPDVPGVLGMFFTGPNTEPQEVFWMFRVFEVHQKGAVFGVNIFGCSTKKVVAKL